MPLFTANTRTPPIAFAVPQFAVQPPLIVTRMPMPSIVTPRDSMSVPLVAFSVIVCGAANTAVSKVIVSFVQLPMLARVHRVRAA